jgi:DNA topoisomerase-1
VIEAPKRTGSELAAWIGRPSTYAPTLTTIQERGYVEKVDKKWAPTDIGELTTDLLVEHFPEIADPSFTAGIETQFDEIADGTREWHAVMKDFYTPFKKHLDEKEASVEKQIVVTETPCPHCGEMMIMKFGRTGKFLACPQEGSKVTLPTPEEAAEIAALEAKVVGEICPLCGKDMKIKKGRFGFFLGCVDYPTCKGVSKIWTRIGYKCPNCRNEKREPQGDIVERKGRGRAKPFYGCNKYPDCTFLMSNLPESEADVMEAYSKWLETPKKDPSKKKVWGKKTTKKVAKKKSTKKVAKKTASTETEPEEVAE